MAAISILMKPLGSTCDIGGRAAFAVGRGETAGFRRRETRVQQPGTRLEQAPPRPRVARNLPPQCRSGIVASETRSFSGVTSVFEASSFSA